MTHSPNPDCPDCAAASARLWGGFRSGCTGCCARAVARSPQFRQAQQSGQQTRAYRQMLDEFGLDHEQVKTAHSADAEFRQVPT